MNGIIIVNKPKGFTSHDVVAKLRGIYKTRRIGHSGTLDPMATGVLPVFIGRATRAVEYATGHDKVYRAQLKLGVTTDTEDITGEILEEKDVSVSLPEFLAAVDSQIGEIEQVPPMYSAIKVGGKKLYELAREGVEVERKARKITVYSIELLDFAPPYATLTISVSKGTYIRTICSDIGKKLGCGATLTSLCRLQAGNYTIDDAHDLDEIQEKVEKLLLPVDSMFSEYPSVTINKKGAKKARNGAEVETDAEPGKTFRVYDENGEFLMLAEVIERGKKRFLKTIKSFFEV